MESEHGQTMIRVLNNVFAPRLRELGRHLDLARVQQVKSWAWRVEHVGTRMKYSLKHKQRSVFPNSDTGPMPRNLIRSGSKQPCRRSKSCAQIDNPNHHCNTSHEPPQQHHNAAECAGTHGRMGRQVEQGHRVTPHPTAANAISPRHVLGQRNLLALPTQICVNVVAFQGKQNGAGERHWVP